MCLHAGPCPRRSPGHPDHALSAQAGAPVSDRRATPVRLKAVGGPSPNGHTDPLTGAHLDALHLVVLVPDEPSYELGRSDWAERSDAQRSRSEASARWGKPPSGMGRAPLRSCLSVARPRER